MMDTISFKSFSHPLSLTPEEMRERTQNFHSLMDGRRTIREYVDTPVDREVIEDCIRAAGTAPSGAHKQPWHFVAISDPEIKKQIREAAEEEEHSFYHGRAGEEWLEALRPFRTNENKPFLTIAPYLIAVFARNYDLGSDGKRSKNYYVPESVGIATGMLITALHQAGLSTLTHTPSPMGFLNKVLGRPSHERAVILLVVGHAAPDAQVPDIERKDLQDIATFI
ncbi:MAG: nitroreductase family protein [Bacteroidetes bacterium]|nr:nitroreductase family protein [Bacteroidota bacterium]